MNKHDSISEVKNDSYYVIEMPSAKSVTCDSRLDMPTVSFVIPTKNSGRTIENCLSSIKKQSYPNIEIVVVDNGSTDDTIEIAKKYTDKIFFDSGKLGRVRQTGIENSEGEIIGIFDSDVYFPHENWLVNAIALFSCAEGVATVWPRNVAPPKAPLFQQLYLNLGNLILEDRIRKRRGIVGGGCALILKDAFFDVGGYDEGAHWGEDFNLAYKLKNFGYKLVYIKDPIFHDTDMGLSIEKFIRKQILGMKTLSRNKFQDMNLSTWDIFYENVIIGIKGMINGLLVKQDISWILFPYLLLLRILIVAYVFLDNIAFTKRWDVEDT